MSTEFSRARSYVSQVALVVATTFVALPLTAVALAEPAQAQSLKTPAISSVTSTNCTGSSPTYFCSSPTVVLGGTSADDNTEVVVADSHGFWYGETSSDGSGNWSVAITLPGSSSAYTLDAFELDTAADQVGTASQTISVTVSSNQLVTDGSFEMPPVPDTACASTCSDFGDWENFDQGSGDVPGWDSTNNYGIEIQTTANGNATAFDGNQFVELASNGVSGITQTISTVPGAQYTLTFAYQARPGTSLAQNTMAVQWGGAFVVGDSQAGTCDDDTVTVPGSGLQGGFGGWTVATYIITGSASPTGTVLEFDDTNPCTEDSVGDFLDDVSVVPTESLAPSNTSWETAQPITLSSVTAGTGDASQAITFSGETLWYDFRVQPGEQLNLQFSNPEDYQILLFSDITQAVAAGAGANGVPVTQAESSSNNDSSTSFSPAYDNPAYDNPAYDNPAYDNPAYDNPAYDNPAYDNPAYDNPAYDNPAYQGSEGDAVVDSLLAESLPAGATSQSVDADTWNATGNFYIEVVSDNGNFSPNSYTVNVTASGGPCQGVTLSSPDATEITTQLGAIPIASTAPSGTQAPYSAVIVDNSGAMKQVGESYTGQDEIYSNLVALAKANNGVILDVSQSEGISQLITQAQQNPTCPYAENLEAQGIQDLINSYRAYTTGGAAENNLQDVVIIGDDDVIPFFRYADAEDIGPEDDYQVPLSSSSAPEAALEDDFYLTDDQYGAASELQINNTLLPVQSAAVGRLVETPADIQTTINNYLSQKVISPTSSLTTGYSFMAQGASEVGQYFADGVGGTYNEQLIDNPAITNPDVWTAGNLLTSLTTRAHQLVFLGAHFNANVALAADDTTNLTTGQFASAIGNNLENSLVISTGCHSGYTIDPQDATPLTDTLSWPQAFAEAGATLIAGTGYQFGDSNYVAYSGQLYVDLAQQLYQTAGKTVSVGSALLDAESQYLASVDQLNGLEEKALLEVTLYGLPMLGVDEPNTAGTTPVASPSTTGIVATGTGNDLINSGTPASTLGTTEYDLPVTVPNLTSYTPLGQPGTPLSYDTLRGAQSPDSQVEADPGAPIVPVITDDVNVPGNTLTGVGFWGGSYTETSGAPPLTGDPVTDVGQLATPFSSQLYLPERLTNPNYFATLDTGAGTELGITPEQYVSDPTTAGNAIDRQYAELDLRLFYSPDASDAALAAPLQISGVTATETTTGQVTVSAFVPGGTFNPVQEVWVTYTNPPGGPLPADGATGTPGSWASVPLSPSLTNPDLWTSTFPDPDAAPGDLIFEVQAANGAGEVSLDNNGGYYFTPTLLSSTGGLPAGPASTSLGLSGDTSVPFGTTADVSATLTATASTSDIASQQVEFTIGSTTVAGSTNASGVASAAIPLSDLAPGNYTVTASYLGNSSYAGTSTSGPFSVTQDTTALQLSVPQSGWLVSGANNGISATLTSPGLGGAGVAQKTVYFEVSNSSGPLAGSVGQTNDAGVADAGVITLPSSDAGQSFTVTSYFAPDEVPVPGPKSPYTSLDPDYVSATSAGSNLTDVASSQTSLVVGPSSWVYGQKVTLTATVSLATNSGSAAPANGDGTVAFAEDGTTIGACTAQSLTSGSASCILTNVPAGSHTFSATYSGYQPNAVNPPLYTGSTSPNESGTATTTACITTTQSSLTVAKGQAACLAARGKISGSVTVAAGGALWVTGGSIGGSLSSTGASAISVSGAAVTGSVSVTGTTGPVTLASDSVGGSVSLSSNTGGVSLTGDSVGGSVSLSSNTGGVSLTGDSVGGSVSLSSNTGGVSFTSDRVTGSLSVSTNTGGVTIISNTITGSSNVTGNTGGTTFTYNTVDGSLNITGNSAPFTYLYNTVHGSVNNSGN